MGLLLRALVERPWSSAAHATPFAVTLRSRPALSTRFNLVRFPAPGVGEAVPLVTCRPHTVRWLAEACERNR